jgi:hypothetical protein
MLPQSNTRQNVVALTKQEASAQFSNAAEVSVRRSSSNLYSLSLFC